MSISLPNRGNVLARNKPFRMREKLDGSTHACSTKMCGGGVGRNMAEALWRLRGGRARLITAVGSDADGRYIQNIAPGLLLEGCVIPDASTATYAAVLDTHGECRLGLGDMDVHNLITPELVNKHKDVLEKAPLIVLDGNVPQPTVDHVHRLCQEIKKPVFFEPTDKRKAVKSLYSSQRITLSSPNIAELRAMAYYINPNLNLIKTTDIDEVVQLSKVVMQKVRFLIITLGSKGVITVTKDENKTVKLYPAMPLNSIKNVSGAGDCFASGFIHGILSGLKESECIFLGFNAAKWALLAETTVPSNFYITDITEAYFKELY